MGLLTAKDLGSNSTQGTFTIPSVSLLKSVSPLNALVALTLKYKILVRFSERNILENIHTLFHLFVNIAVQPLTNIIGFQILLKLYLLFYLWVIVLLKVKLSNVKASKTIVSAGA